MTVPTHDSDGTPIPLRGSAPEAAPSPGLLGRAAERAAMTAGWGLGAVFGVVAALRRARPLHPVGKVMTATLQVRPTGEPTGVPLLDEAREYRCLVRQSRATGVPSPAPDIVGVALRIVVTEAGVERPADLLFASTGTGAVSRFTLALRRSAGSGPLTTLLPMAAKAGPLLLALRPNGDGDTFRLAWAHVRGDWHDCGILRIERDDLGDDYQELRFDGIANPLPGLAPYAVVRALREPSYLLARQGFPGGQRGDSTA